ncbi:MAG: GspE/PulE family protein [Pseudomonadota bacterium]
MSAEPQLPASFAKREGVLLTYRADGAAQVTARHDASWTALQEVQRILTAGFYVETVAEQDYAALFETVYGGGESDDITVQIEDASGLFRPLDGSTSTDILADETEAPVVNLINSLLRQALRKRASDMHFEPQENGLMVRMRVDGVLQPILERNDVPTAMVISRLKVMAELDIAETRLPQDGRIGLRLAERAVDVRVSTIPSQYGERIVLRILDKDTGLLSLDAIGLDDAQKAIIDRLTNCKNGLVLVTGPTGSGKTTTLYAILDKLNSKGTNILTVEDPVEYDLVGVGQTQVNSQIGMSFASALRAVLRQDPDIVLVGEIRDAETASVAVQAALTGHLVLSTLHTNTALGAITRLRDLGVEPFLLTSTLRGAIAQRLMRLLCPGCKTPVATPDDVRAVFKKHQVDVPETVFEAKGCTQCSDTGYAGRTGVYDLIENSAGLRQAIGAEASEAEMIDQGTLPADGMFASGLRAVAAGRTTMTELLRVVSDVT